MGMIILGVYLILVAIASFGIPIPPIVLGIAALIAGLLILVGK